MRYRKICENRGLNAKEMPVPRTLSSSCGTCVSYEAIEPVMDEKYLDEVEQIVLVVSDGYEGIYSAEG